jgi:hypothetical protein
LLSRRMRMGTRLSWTRVCATLPSTQRVKPVLPWPHNTMRSTSPDLTSARMHWAGIPKTTSVVVWITASVGDAAIFWR